MDIVKSRNAEKLLGPILQFDNRIRTVTVIGPMGEPFASVERPGLTSLEPSSVTSRFFKRTALAGLMGGNEDRYHGRTKVVIAMREKLTLVCLMVSDRIILISAEPTFPLSRVGKLGELVDQLNLESLASL